MSTTPIKKVLVALQDRRWIQSGLFRPSSTLKAAWLRAVQLSGKGKRGKPLKGNPLSPHGASLVGAGGDANAAYVLHQLKYWASVLLQSVPNSGARKRS